MSNLITRESFSATFPVDGLEFCITQIETAIVDAKVKLSEMEPDFKAVEEMYIKAKREVEMIQDDVSKKTMWLSNLIENRGRNKGKSNVRVIRTTSHNTDKGKDDIQKRDSWLTPAVMILEKERRFLTPEALFELVIKEFPILAKKYVDGYSTGIKVRVIANYIRAAKTEKKKGVQVVTFYKEKIGLYKWMAKDHPIPSFMKEFMFNNEAVASHG